MNKKLVFLALVLVAVLACAIAVADTASYHWENTDTLPYDLVEDGVTIKVPGEADPVPVIDVAIYKEPTCDTPAQWKLYYISKGQKVYVIGYFKYGFTRPHMGHVWASENMEEWAITKIEYVNNGVAQPMMENDTASYQVTYANGQTQTLRGAGMTKLPTCDTNGAAKDFCVYCGKVRDNVSITVPKLNHIYEEVIYKYPNCKKPEDGLYAFKCKNCGNYRKTATGAVETYPLYVDDDTYGMQTKTAADGHTYKQGNARFADAYVKAGYELATGHKWDGLAPGETPCIQSQHCLICEQTRDKVSAPETIVLKSSVIDCYTIQEVRVCNKCNGKTSTSITGDNEHDRHDQRVATVTSYQLFAQSTEANDNIENHAWHALDLSSAKKYYDKNATYSVPALGADSAITYTNCWDSKQYNAAMNMCITGYSATYKCATCGKLILKYFGPEGHDFTAWEMHYAPGAGANVEGEWTRYCKKCNSTETYHGTKAPSASYVSEVADTENGFQYKDGAWGVYVNGNLQDGMNTLARYMGGWFVVKNGKWDTSYEGLYTYDGGQFYVSGGQVRNDLQGFVNTKSGFLYFADGMLQKVTTLVQYDGAWFYIVDGALATGYTGPVVYDGATFNVVGGQVQF
jgi:hypothetical protein